MTCPTCRSRAACVRFRVDSAGVRMLPGESVVPAGHALCGDAFHGGPKPCVACHGYDGMADGEGGVCAPCLHDYAQAWGAPTGRDEARRWQAPYSDEKAPSRSPRHA